MLIEALSKVIPSIWPLLLLAVAIPILLAVLKAHLAATGRRAGTTDNANQSKAFSRDSLPVHQLDAIANVNFETVPLLNREEARLLPQLEKFVLENAPGHRVMAQVSILEILKPLSIDNDKAAEHRAFRAINAKRIDFAVFDCTGRIIAAIEYQGTGHFQNRAVVRDAVKREVFRKAGIPFIEAKPDMPFHELAAPIEREIRRKRRT